MSLYVAVVASVGLCNIWDGYMMLAGTECSCRLGMARGMVLLQGVVRTEYSAHIASRTCYVRYALRLPVIGAAAAGH
jgi:hypothetical protein